MIETPLLRGLLDKLGVMPSATGADPTRPLPTLFPERELTPAHESAEVAGGFARPADPSGIAAGRALEAPSCARLIDEGPYLALRRSRPGWSTG